MRTISENTCFGGVQGVYSHASKATGCDMTFGLFLPAEAKTDRVPVLYYLSGLTCTHENAMIKAGAQGWAAEQGIALVFPDTSPRGAGVSGPSQSLVHGSQDRSLRPVIAARRASFSPRSSASSRRA